MRLVLLSIFLVMKAWVCRNVKGSLSVANLCFVGSKLLLCDCESSVSHFGYGYSCNHVTFSMGKRLGILI